MDPQRISRALIGFKLFLAPPTVLRYMVPSKSYDGVRQRTLCFFFQQGKAQLLDITVKLLEKAIQHNHVTEVPTVDVYVSLECSRSMLGIIFSFHTSNLNGSRKKGSGRLHNFFQKIFYHVTKET